MDPKVLECAKVWSTHEAFALKDRQEIKTLLDSLPHSEAELMERFIKDLEFGTGGLRAPINIGQNCINTYTIRRATYALAKAFLKYHALPFSAVVSYDSRKFSREFAEEVCGVFAQLGIQSHLFYTLTPTPMLSYAIRKLKAKGGVMITASHNPPKYNGYKAYWDDGAQVVPPYDKEIIDIYNSLTDWGSLKSMPIDEARKKGLVKDTTEQMDLDFYQMIEEKVIQNKKMCLESGSKLKVVFTPIHGTGRIPCEKITKRLGFTEFKTLLSQAQPDSNFSTVKSPNPEDPEALKLAIEEMKKTNADLVMGTDPDCDRLGVVVNQQNQPYFLTGNQIGALFLDYILIHKKVKNPFVIKSIVTSSIQDAIVESYGGKVENTLTGFKWMAKLIRENENREFVFASEESFGYMPHNESRDKDGVSSVALMCEVALFHKLQGRTLVQALDLMSEKYGYFEEALVSRDYEGIEGAKKINRIMEFFRAWKSKEIAGEKISVIEDYLNGYKNIPASNVLGFHFESGDKLYLRPSGTEPKIKFYIMTKVKYGNLEQKKLSSAAKILKFQTLINEICGKA